MEIKFCNNNNNNNKWKSYINTGYEIILNSSLFDWKYFLS